MASRPAALRGADAWKARVDGRTQRALDGTLLLESNWRAGRRSSVEAMVVVLSWTRCAFEVWPRECARASSRVHRRVIPPVVFVSIFRACRALRLLCTATPESELFVMALLFIFLSLLLSLIVSFIFFPAIVRFLGQQVGHYLRRSCLTRRELLLARVATESKNYEAEHADVEDYDWEEIASVATDGRVGSKQDKQWEGIVGFFHPFWYGAPRSISL